jgi:plastocyanin
VTIRLALALSSVVAVLAVGCGGDDDNSGDQSPSGVAAAQGQAIVMQNTRFNPADVTVKVGQQVIWRNLDGIRHNVTATSGADFKSSDLAKNETFTFTAKDPATIKYVCTLHPGMDGTLHIVEP